jgi:hypothetical protein
MVALVKNQQEMVELNASSFDRIASKADGPPVIAMCIVTMKRNLF